MGRRTVDAEGAKTRRDDRLFQRHQSIDHSVQQVSVRQPHTVSFAQRSRAGSRGSSRGSQQGMATNRSARSTRSVRSSRSNSNASSHRGLNRLPVMKYLDSSRRSPNSQTGRRQGGRYPLRPPPSQAYTDDEHKSPGLSRASSQSSGSSRASVDMHETSETSPRTRTLMMQSRRQDNRPDISYDLDGDGVVNQKDYFLAKQFDTNQDGVLDEKEMVVARQKLAEGYGDYQHQDYFDPSQDVKGPINVTKAQAIVKHSLPPFKASYDDTYNHTMGPLDQKKRDALSTDYQRGKDINPMQKSIGLLEPEDAHTDRSQLLQDRRRERLAYGEAMSEKHEREQSAFAKVTRKNRDADRIFQADKKHRRKHRRRQRRGGKGGKGGAGGHGPAEDQLYVEALDAEQTYEQSLDSSRRGEPAPPAPPRSQLHTQRKQRQLPDVSFDVDGDKAVGARDYFLAKTFDADKNGVLDAQEKAAAERAVAETSLGRDDHNKKFQPSSKLERVLLLTEKPKHRSTFSGTFAHVIGNNWAQSPTDKYDPWQTTNRATYLPVADPVKQRWKAIHAQDKMKKERIERNGNTMVEPLEATFYPRHMYRAQACIQKPDVSNGWFM